MGKLMAAPGWTRVCRAIVRLNGKGNCDSAREAARGADALITMLPDGDAVRDAVLDALPSLSPAQSSST